MYATVLLTSPSVECKHKKIGHRYCMVNVVRGTFSFIFEVALLILILFSLLLRKT